MPDSNRPSLFTRPDEPPLGYEAIRAWLKKPRPLLRSVLGWIPLFLSKLYDAGVFIRKNARPGAKWVQEAAKKAEPVVRAGAKVGQGVRNVGTRMSAAAGAFRDPEGKNLGRERQVRRAGDTTQKYGERITAGSEVAGAFLSVLASVAGVFTPKPPISINPDVVRESPEDTEDAPEPDGRFLPRQPDKRPSAPAGGRTEPVPEPPQPGANSDSATDVQETQPEVPHESGTAGEKAESPPERPHESSAPGEAPRTPPEPPQQTPGPDRAEVTPPDLPEDEPAPAEAAEDPARTSTTDALEPEPETRPERRTPSPAPPAPPEDRFEGVPKELLLEVKSIRGGERLEPLRPLILSICLAREWTTAKQLARWLSAHRRSLVQRHLGPLVDDEFLILRFPDKVRSRNQAYRTNPEKWPPRR
ncbi:MAG: hypothetical protein OXI45_05845 [Acidobacteriota bacterium]|nr:hypothetical protein [Acidobacteriota bacterium]